MWQPYIITQLRSRGCLCWPTGSREICPALAEPDSDYDWIVYIPLTFDRLDLYLSKCGFTIPENDGIVEQYDEEDTEAGLGSVPWYKTSEGKVINLIVVRDLRVAARWVAATAYCKVMNVASREERIATFRLFRQSEFDPLLRKAADEKKEYPPELDDEIPF